MKKLVSLVAITLLGLPACAALNFYRAANGKVVLEATDCQNITRFMNLVTPDDPPVSEDGEEPVEYPAEDSTGEPTEDSAGEPMGEEEATVPPQEDPATRQAMMAGSQTILQAVFGQDEQAPQFERKYAANISQEVDEKITPDNFNEHQEALLTFVRDVNWKTGLNFTWSDMGFFRRLKMVCFGSNQLNKPERVELESYTGSLDGTMDSISDGAVDALSDIARGYTLASMAQLSTDGLIDVLDNENPFLLLAIDEETYAKLVNKNPQVQALFENLYKFFKIRSVLLGAKYDTNIKQLVRISKLGKGNYFKTWEALAEYAKKILELARNGKVTPQDEKSVHIWRLENVMERIYEQRLVEKQAAKILAKDPKNAALIQEMQKDNKKKLSRKDKARKLIENITQDEVKRLLGKYIVK